MCECWFASEGLTSVDGFRFGGIPGAARLRLRGTDESVRRHTGWLGCSRLATQDSGDMFLPRWCKGFLLSSTGGLN